GRRDHLVPARRVRRAGAQGLGHHLPREDQPLDRAAAILFSWITRPFTDTLNWSANRVVRLLGIRGTTAELERIHSPEEIRMLVAQSRRRGGLDAGDARMLEGVFEFSEKTAREVMTPRTDMVALPLELTLEEAADQVAVA